MKNKYFFIVLFLVLCTSVNAQPGDDMESYVGVVCGNGWVNPCSILVSTAYAHSPVQSGYIDGAGIIDSNLDLGNKIFGIWHLSFWGYIPSGRSAYFNVQAGLPPIPSWCGEFYFNRDNTNPGGGEVVGFNPFTFTFPHDQWFFIEMTWDISMGLSLATWCMNVDGVTVVLPGTTYVDSNGDTAAGLGGLNFFSAHPTNEFYIDDFTYDAAAGSCIITGIDSQKEIKFSATPNPVLNILRIEASDQISEITIYNLTGKQIFQTSINSLSAEIDMSNYAKGVYFIKLNIGASQGIVKIIR